MGVGVPFQDSIGKDLDRIGSDQRVAGVLLTARARHCHRARDVQFAVGTAKLIGHEILRRIHMDRQFTALREHVVERKIIG